MAADFHDQRREARARGGSGGAARVWIRTVVDMLRRAPREQALVVAADARYAFRMMRRHLGSTVVIIALLAIGIGANAAVFGFTDPVVARPLPVPEPNELVRVVRAGASGSQTFSHPVFRDIAERSRMLAGLAAHQYTTVSVGTGEAATPVGGEIVSGTYFDVYGVRPLLGRLLQTADDGAVGGAPVVVISYALWQQQFGGAPSAVGATLRLNGHTFEVIGVAPASFTGSYTAFSSRFWAPIAMYKQVRPRRESLTARGWEWLALTARLRPGTSPADAEADLRRVARELVQEHPDPDGAERYSVVAASGLPEGQQRGATTVLLFAAIIGALVLLVTCANIAGVQQSRAMARVRETSIRCALGASRGRVMRQWLTESTCLALLGAAAGLLVQRWIQAGIAGELRAAWPVEITQVSVADVRMLAFTILVAMGASLLFGLLPAWRSAAPGEASLRETASSIAGSRRGRAAPSCSSRCRSRSASP